MDDKEKQYILANLKQFRLADAFTRAAARDQKDAPEAVLQEATGDAVLENQPAPADGQLEQAPFLDAKQQLYIQEARQDCDDIIVCSNWQDLEFEITERKSNLALNIRGKKMEFSDPKVLADHLREAQSMIVNTDLTGSVYMMINWIDENAYICPEDHV